MIIVEVLFWLSLAVPLYGYLGYPLLLSLCHLLICRRASRPDDAFTPSVSIVLAAYNEVTCIRSKLENCLTLDYPSEKLEILVGSDGSDDGTNAIVEEFRDRGVNLLAFHPRRGKMATVNRIVREAKGEVCLFSDISELLDGVSLHKLVRHFADPTIGAVTGNHIYHEKATGVGFGTKFYWRFQRFLQKIESRLCTVCACDGTIYMCRRDLFPFPADHTINDDVAVPLGIIRDGKRVIFEPEAIARGEVLPATRRFFRQKIRGQAGRYQIYTMFPRMFLPWPPGNWWVFISHHVFPVAVPWFLILAFMTNVVLSFSGYSLFRILLSGQVAFYLLAALGWIAERRGRYLAFGTIPFYFVVANIGSLCGFFAYVSGVQRAAWRKVE